MSETESYHVVRGRNHWAVKSDGLILSAHDTQKQAIKSGKMIAKMTQGELLIHGRNGKIREKNSFGSDSISSKG